MGVTGLWRLVEPAGKPVPVETLENKVLAVDISIWLHQVVKGYQDAKGAPLPNAHLIGLFQRLCKLLYFRIKPIFVFDGAFPELKKETIAKRQVNKAKYNSESERIKRELAILLSKKTAIGSLLGNQISPKKTSTAKSNNDDDLFKLPALPKRDSETESESEEEDSSGSITDLHSIDIETESFKNRSVKEKYELLIELKETRKMNSWGKLHELPKKSDNFSDYQMQRLLKRRKVQECLEETEKEMGQSGMSLNDLEILLNEEGIDTKMDDIPTRRIASNNTTRYLLIQNVKQALADMKKKKEMETKVENCEDKKEQIVKEEPKVKSADDSDDELQKAIQMSLECDDEIKVEDKQIINNVKKDELQDDLEKAIKMSLECTDDHNVTASSSKTDESWTSFTSDTEYKDSDDEVDDYVPPDLSSAKAYIKQYTDFTNETIDKIIATKTSNKSKPEIPSVNQILEELQQNKSVIVDNINLSSDDENSNQNIADSHNKMIEIHNQSATGPVITSSTDTPICKTDKPDESVLCIDDTQEIISLDTSSTQDNVYPPKKEPVEELSSSENEEYEEVPQVDTKTKTVILTNEPVEELSSSEDEEFEEVPEIETKSKTVVQLDLNIETPPLPEDDIFSDVFIKPVNSNIIIESESNPKDIKETKEDIDKSKTHSSESSLTHKNISSKNDNPKILQSDTIVLNNVELPTELINSDKNDSNKSSDETVIKNILPATTETKEQSPAEDTNKTDTVEKEDTPKVLSDPISTIDLNNMVKDIQNEEQDLIQEKGRLDRIGRNITEQMTREAQELLQIFGVPYIVAPTEAEAQCAFLENANLTDGTITDDSDIWLFGGKNVYKNFFNNKKSVMQFLAERIEKSFNLTREQLILLALLVGSDYTTGLSGVGPVTALEILAHFPISKNNPKEEETPHNRYVQIIYGLKEFKKWLQSGRRTDNISLKKKLKSVKVNDDFPSLRVVQAYMEPRVDKSEEKFTWGKLDITVLRDYAKAKFGWSQNKLDEIIKPVIKRMADRNTQRSVQDFFKRKIDFQSLEDQMSKRVKAAVQRMGPGEEITDDLEVKKTVTKRRIRDTNKQNEAGPSKIIKNKHSFNIATQVQDSKVEIKIPKTDRVQEIIPQREKDLQKLMQNKMKAIEVFRKTNIDKKRKYVKRKPNLPKDKADLSESSDSN